MFDKKKFCNCGRIVEIDNKSLIDGYLAAVQFIGITMGEESLAEYALNESGYSCNELLKSQKKSGFETRRMNKIIRRATRNK